MKTIWRAAVIGILFTTSTYAQTLDWVKTIVGSGNQIVHGTAIDASGNVYNTGEFWSTTDFDPGTGSLSLSSQGNADIFVQKLDADGNLLWAYGFGSGGEDIGRAIDVDQNGNVYITGAFRGTIDFDPGAGTNPLTFGGYSDIFVLKLTENGDFVWAKNFKSFSDFSTGLDIKSDAFGNVYTTGKMKADVDFDPGSGTNTVIAVGSDIFIHKLDANGDFDWVRTYGGSGPYVEEGQSIEMDEQGDLYISGTFLGTVDFDSGLGVSELTAVGARPSLFVLKMKPNANFVWVKGYGSTSLLTASARDMAINGNDLYVVGTYHGTTDFDPGSGVQNETSDGSGDIYIEKLDTAGNFQWVRTIGNQAIDNAFSVATDYFSNVYVTGEFAGTVDFDPDPIATLDFTAGYKDPFVVKLDASGDLDWAFNYGQNGAGFGSAIHADQFGTNLWISGAFSSMLDFDPTGVSANISSVSLGDGFTQKINQAVSCIPTFAQIMLSTCDGNPLTSPSGNAVWTQSGTYMDTLQNAAGCDSIITVDLTILQPLTAQLDTNICAGTTYQSPSGNYTWSQPGMYQDTLVATSGCDSVLTINLTVTSVDNGVTQQNEELTANQAGATYQWYDCNNNQPIQGETNALFTATANGSYAVEVTFQNCFVLSDCYDVTTLDIETLEMEVFRVFPNPTAGNVTVATTETAQPAMVEVRNALGELLSVHGLNGTTDIQLSEEKGVYLVYIVSSEKQSVYRVVKQ